MEVEGSGEEEEMGMSSAEARQAAAETKVSLV